MKIENKIKWVVFDKMLPIYFPRKNQLADDKIFLAIWNCGKRPQTLFQAIRDTRITLRKGSGVIFVIKKGHI